MMLFESPMHFLVSLSLFLSLPASVRSSNTKKGAGILATPGISSAVSSLNLSWGYGWIQTPESAFTDESEPIPSGIDLVPMVSKTWLATADVFAAIKTNTRYSSLLGFNEPDVNGETPQAAAALWPFFESTGLRLGSPAPANTSLQAGDWFVEFMSQIDSRVDFIALHCYGQLLDDVAGSVANCKSYIEAVHAKYGKPIWLTETAMATWQPQECWQNGCYASEAQQQAFALAMTQMLDSLDESVLERYAWFEVGGGVPSDMMANGKLTAIGQTYSTI